MISSECFFILLVTHSFYLYVSDSAIRSFCYAFSIDLEQRFTNFHLHFHLMMNVSVSNAKISFHLNKAENQIHLQIDS